jgi:hypothetical protein
MLSGFQGDESATAPEDYGIDGVLFNVCYDAPWTRGDLKVFTRQMQADLNSGKKDLSLGYTCDFELRSGVYDGVPFEAVQTNMRGNHIALVDMGRVPGAKVLDGKSLCFDHLDFSVVLPHDGDNMKRKGKALDSSVVAQLQAQLKALLPTFEQFLSEEATEPAHQEGAEAGAAGAEAGNAAPAATGEAGSEAGAAGGEMGGETGAGEVAAENTEQGAAAGGEEGETDNGAAAAGAEGGEGAGGESAAGGAAQLISQLEAILAQLKQATGGAQDGEEMGGEEGGATNAEGETNDTVEGLEGAAREGADEGGATGEQGRASEGPAAGKHAGADAALRTFHADLAAKNRFVERLSKVVGAFDGAMDLASATSGDVAAYGVKKLKIRCAKGQESIALDAYLTGIESARKTTANATQTKRAADAAQQEVPAIDAYFKE